MKCYYIYLIFANFSFYIIEKLSNILGQRKEQIEVL